MTMFFVAGIVIAVFIELLLVSKKNKSESDIILTVWMFMILVHLFLFYIHFTEDIYKVPFLLGIEHPLPLLHGVFLYFYVSSLTNRLPRNRTFLLIHFLPAVILYLVSVQFFVLPADRKIEIYRNHGAGYEWFTVPKSYAIALSGIFYVSWSALLLRRHRHAIRDQFSDVEHINLRWLQILTYGLGVIWLIVLLTHNDTLVFTGVVVFVFLIGFFGIRQVDVFAHGSEAETRTEAGQKEKYRKSGLTEEASEELLQKLKQLMVGEGLYRKSDLSITDLSERLDVHPNYLSQVINQKEKKNFYDFVNTYRIEEFKRMIAGQKSRQFTLLSIAHDCGFSSKTSFNRYFKKATGQTPSQYVAQVTRNEVLPE